MAFDYDGVQMEALDGIYFTKDRKTLQRTQQQLDNHGSISYDNAIEEMM
jgi:hypothetical protein